MFTIVLGGLLPGGLPTGGAPVGPAVAATAYEGAALPGQVARHESAARHGTEVRRAGGARYESGGSGRTAARDRTATRGRAGRLARARLEVALLDAAASRAGRSYREGLRAARAERARAARLTERLRRERRTAAALRRTAGRIAAEQYRTGSGLSYAVRVLAAASPEDLLRGHRLAERRERAVAARARTALRASRELAAGSAAAAGRTQALDARQQRLAGERARIGRSLDRARGRLWRLVTGAAGSGCAGPPDRVASAAGLLAPAAVPARGWTRPVTGYALSASYGGAGAHWAHRHTGQDFAVPVGTPVRSAGRGRVTAVECGGPYGISVVVRHGGRTYTQYAHLSAVLVRPGQRVRAGQPIALSGNTGNSTGPHLHFEVRRGPGADAAVEPLHWLRGRGVRV
ncbi:M23 family metallopeptidase [Streptomyces sp. NPDC050315]|uniref:M23 family metallopeptidase n=1 Tax=Streptomyces sp. NPDC050315 TaxID=3155039 RepID=UPI00342582DF